MAKESGDAAFHLLSPRIHDAPKRRPLRFKSTGSGTRSDGSATREEGAGYWDLSVGPKPYIGEWIMEVSLPESAVSMRSLSKSYRDRVTLDDITLDIPRAMVYGLLGPNGAGKTTIVRILSTIIKPTSGSASVNGHDVATHGIDVRKSIGVLPEDTGLYDRLTAVETLRFYGGVQGLSGSRLDDRIDELLTMFELSDRKKDRVAKYSRGMRQKLALARALIHDPPVLLLDEPTLGLDVMSTRAIRDYVGRMATEGKTVILTSNNMYEAQTLCKELTILNRGRILVSGTVEQLEEMVKTKGLEEVFVQLVRGENGVSS